MTNEELFARQIANLNSTVLALGQALHASLVLTPAATPEAKAQIALTLSDNMQSFHDTQMRLFQLVQEASRRPGIILPN